jgi:lipopolysaccharide/colanic/teichoic acid biosynthesis glycosyltransferase
LATAPLFVVIALAVKLSGPGPVLYSQRRVGRDGREFDLLKFRSMRVEPSDVSTFRPGADIAPGGVEGVDRRTTVGRFLRKTSLDELPQLLNVLRGDMSLVGPRPERPEFVLLFRERMPRYQDRLRVKAGITGWAQVHGLRGQTSLTDRIEWDNHYIENWSLLLDLKILVLTLLAIFKPQER